MRFPLKTVATAFDPRSNIVGFMRLFLAGSVLVSHSFILGFGRGEPLTGWFRGQTNLGTLAVYGFFVLSGFLIFRSATRLGSAGRYFWHRVLRIFPAFWVCLVVTALVAAPAVYLAHRGTLHGFFTESPSPVGYLVENAWLTMHQYGIGTILAGTPWGTSHGSVFNGSLWSLHYEFLCYILVALAVYVGRGLARPIVLLAFLAVLASSVHAFRAGPGFAAAARELPGSPHLGIDGNQLAVLLLAFLLGAVAAAYPRWFPLDARVAAIAAVIVVITAREGYFGAVGVPAFSYLVLWASALSIPRLRQIGARNDYSYGVYIYAFPIQQILVWAGLSAAGLPAYVAACAALTAVAACASWHLVERPAMRWKEARLVLGARKPAEGAAMPPAQLGADA